VLGTGWREYIQSWPGAPDEARIFIHRLLFYVSAHSVASTRRFRRAFVVLVNLMSAIKISSEYVCKGLHIKDSRNQRASEKTEGIITLKPTSMVNNPP
jgi:hypothetical protein